MKTKILTPEQVARLDLLKEALANAVEEFEKEHGTVEPEEHMALYAFMAGASMAAMDPTRFTAVTAVQLLQENVNTGNRVALNAMKGKHGGH